jgi:hypothetical protein
MIAISPFRFPGRPKRVRLSIIGIGNTLGMGHRLTHASRKLDNDFNVEFKRLTEMNGPPRTSMAACLQSYPKSHSVFVGCIERGRFKEFGCCVDGSGLSTQYSDYIHPSFILHRCPRYEIIDAVKFFVHSFYTSNHHSKIGFCSFMYHSTVHELWFWFLSI